MRLLNKFWHWYEKNLTLNIGVAAGLFLLQIIHLIWLFGEVVWFKMFGSPLFALEGVWKAIIILVDYTEIPAIITTSLVYINEIRKRQNFKSWAMLVFINSQWIHLLWLTDEFVVEAIRGESLVLLPLWLAWVAVLIDYLELPVIVDTLSKFFKSLRERRVKDFLQYELRED